MAIIAVFRYVFPFAKRKSHSRIVCPGKNIGSLESEASTEVAVMGSFVRDADLPYVAAKAAVELDSGLGRGDDLPGLKSLRSYLQQWVSPSRFPWLPESLRRELLLDVNPHEEGRLNACSDVERAMHVACEQAGLQQVRASGGLLAVARVVLESLDECIPVKKRASSFSEDIDRSFLDHQLPAAGHASKETLVKFCVSLSSEILESQQQFADGSEARFYF
jgi:hypothetical protein